MMKSGAPAYAVFLRLKEDYNERAGRTQSYITDRIWPLGELVEINGLIYAEYFDAGRTLE